MNREQYETEARRLLRAFANVYDQHGPAGRHNTEAARIASVSITRHASNFRPEWYRK